ncbi:DUF4190 domain-containing protein [Leifsonia sp. 2MCAF36]|uniref:DUF4190 domain-containing protein n=1 Tax=Leifsonia sp. 2MCAF36 TaxID=3232988 RepID=UPI003F9AECC0
MSTSTSTARFNTTAVVAFVLSFFIPILGLILGVLALPKVAASGERGSGLAKWAIALGLIVTVSWILQFTVWHWIVFSWD